MESARPGTAWEAFNRPRRERQLPEERPVVWNAERFSAILSPSKSVDRKAVTQPLFAGLSEPKWCTGKTGQTDCRSNFYFKL